MVTSIILLLIAGALAAIFLFNQELFSLKSKGASYMEQMARFLEVELEKEGQAEYQVWRVQFEVKGQKFVYEHIQQAGVNDAVVEHGCLKIASEDTISLNFLEKSHGGTRSKAGSLDDLTKNPWGGAVNTVSLPPTLQEFRLLTNDTQKATMIMADDQVLKIFSKFKNRDSRGKPGMSLEVSAGKVILHFYPNKALNPNIFEFYSDVYPIEDYASGLIPLLDRINVVRREMEA